MNTYRYFEKIFPRQITNFLLFLFLLASSNFHHVISLLARRVKCSTVAATRPAPNFGKITIIKVCIHILFYGRHGMVATVCVCHGIYAHGYLLKFTHCWTRPRELLYDNLRRYIGEE